MEKTNTKFIKSSYDINQIAGEKGENAILKIVQNPNLKSNFGLISSSFNIIYLSIKEDGVYQLSSHKEHTERVNDICFFNNQNSESQFQNSFFSGSSDGTFKLWDLRCKESLKTVKTGMKIYSLDCNDDTLAIAMDREILLYDLKTMKNKSRCKFAHSQDVLSIKYSKFPGNSNTLISGGEDCIINLFDVEPTSGKLSMDSVLYTMNTNQSLINVDFIDPEYNFLKCLTTVNTYQYVNLFSGIVKFEFDAKNVIIFLTYIILGGI
jgi:WD40 repeat protein